MDYLVFYPKDIVGQFWANNNFGPLLPYFQVSSSLCTSPTIHHENSRRSAGKWRSSSRLRRCTGSTMFHWVWMFIIIMCCFICWLKLGFPINVNKWVICECNRVVCHFMKLIVVRVRMILLFKTNLSPTTLTWRRSE